MEREQFRKEAYDFIYTNNDIYQQHYSKIYRYFNVWDYICRRLSNLNYKNDNLLDLGCGAGHLANMLYDRKFKNYIGIDFSNVAIQKAKICAPTYTFIEADLRNIDYSVYKDFKIISVETFEHLENDIKIIKKLPKNNYIIFSVPNYLCDNHYRVYDNPKFIKNYYKDVLNIIRIKSFNISEQNIIFVVEANIK